ncbi:MAG TPA: kelch repeat-containing protein, partial [Polyangium sp.]|nr:kelch repeat-containing protein [Polyangium sp.]
MFSSPTAPLQRVLLLALVASGFACVSVPQEPGGAQLRERFPAHTSAVLDVGDDFITTREGFVSPSLGAAASNRSRMSLTLPRRGEDELTLRTQDGFEIRIDERGLRGDGAREAHAVVYPHDGGASFWSAVEEGFEEWLLLDEKATAGDGPVASWDVSGARLRQEGSAVEILDGHGEERIRVTAPAAFAQDGRRVDVRLAVRGETIELYADAKGRALLVDPLWTTPPALNLARWNHTATRLQNGKVLIAGGSPQSDANIRTATVEIYDPVTGTFTAAAPMTMPRTYHTATLLLNGKVLVVGGQSPDSQSAEVYDPATDQWTSTPNMGAAHARHDAALLLGGQVAVVGGRSGASGSAGVAQIDLYDPATNTWSTGGVLSKGRFDLRVTTLLDGKVLVTGGVVTSPSTAYVATAELCDPLAGNCAALPAMSEPRGLHTATRLLDGGVLVTGGTGSGVASTASCQLYDPSTNMWKPAPSLSVPRRDQTATLLQNGKVLVTAGYTGGMGGGYYSSAEIYNPATNTWASTASMTGARVRHAATLLQDGKVLVTGGFDGTPIAISQLYDPAEGNSAACSIASDCASGFCVDGVCCATACDAGPCDACSVAAGAEKDGTCSLLTGNACDDGNACTQTDACMAGVCQGGNVVVCSPTNDCHEPGMCDVQTGQCSELTKQDGSPCMGGTCMGGTCVQGGTGGGGAGGNGGSGGAGGNG